MQHQELPIIDLLDNINDQMDIELKSERISPKMDMIESCLLSNHTIDNSALDSTHEEHHNDHRQEHHHQQQQQHQQHQQHQMQTGQSSDNDLLSFTESRRLRSRNGPLHANHQNTSRIHNKHDEHSSRTYCNFCQKTFSRAWSLQRHLADTHFYVPQSLSCDQCGRSYKSRNSLVSHKSQYHARKDRREQEVQCEVTY